jgi:hypothetical protein
MKSARTRSIICLGALLAACSGMDPAAVGDEELLDESGEAIIRADSEDGKRQVVFVIATTFFGDVLCSGVYVEDRMILTAAHCLDNNIQQILIYHGDDLDHDAVEIGSDANGRLTIPAPGQPSHFAEGDSWEKHPDWDANLIHPDLGVIYLDRKLPFRPLPVARFRLGNNWIGKDVTISGWGADTVTGPVSAFGEGVRRTGTATFVGSPTAADYHPEDPNPGMLDPVVRSHVIKVDGSAPNSNGCFGDSGGPMLVKKGGQTYVAGIDYFGGLFCEDYTLYTRIDPFLSFIDDAKRRTGREDLRPQFECVDENDDGTYTAFFGYKNDNGVSLTIPYGRDNQLELDMYGYRPERFLPGEHPFAFAVDFKRNQTVKYTVDPRHDRSTTLVVNKHSRRCGADDASEVECADACQAQLRSGCDGMPEFEACMRGCVDMADIIALYYAPECAAANSAVNGCLADTPAGGANWSCLPDNLPEAPGCSDEVTDLYTCLGF